MQIINKRYKILELLGKGNYGITYKVHDIESDSIVALKIVDLNLITRKKNFQLIEQFKLLSYINHPFIIKPISIDKVYFLDDITFDHEAYFYTMPFIKNSLTIDNFIKENSKDEKLIIETLFKIISSINYLHYFNISHNDIQKYNILINKDSNDPILLDLFPINLEKELFYIDYKNLKNIVLSLNIKLPKVINFFNKFENSNYNFELIYKYYSRILSEKPELYFFNRNIIPDSSTFHLKKFFDKIIKDDNNFFLIAYHDTFFVKIFSNNFFNYLKPQLNNTIYFNNINDLITFLHLRTNKDINENNLLLILSEFIYKFNLNIVTNDFFSLDNKSRKIIYFIINEFIQKSKNIKLYVFSSKLEISFNKSIQKLRIGIQEKDGQEALKQMFNLLNFKIPTEFIENDPSHIYALYFSYCSAILNNKNLRKLKNEIFQNLINFYNQRFNLETLTLSQKLIIYLFCISDTPLFLDEIFKIKYPNLNHNEISELLKKNIIIQNELKFFELYNNFLKYLFNKVLFSKNKKFFNNFGIFFLKNNKTTPIKEKTYIELLYQVNKNDLLIKELIEFIKKYPIYSWYDEFSDIYEFVFSIDINNYNYDDIIFLIYNYYLFHRICLNKYFIIKLQNWLKNYKKIEEDKLIYNYLILIDLFLIFFDYKRENFKTEYKKIDLNFILNNNLYFFINELFYFSIHLDINENIEYFFELLLKKGNITYLNNIEICLLLFSLSHLIQKKESISYEEKNRAFLTISDIIYNDSIEIKLYPLSAKVKHNIAYILEKIDKIKYIQKSINLYNESITIYKKFKMYSQLALTYNNLTVIHESTLYDTKKSLEYQEKSLYYAKLSNTNKDTLAFILINLMIKYFEHFNFYKYRKTAKELLDIFQKNPDIPYKLRFISLYLLYLTIFSKKSVLDAYIKEGNNLLNNSNFSEHFSLFISCKIEVYFLTKNFKKLNNTFYCFFDKNYSEENSEVIKDYLYYFLLYSVVYNVKIKLKESLVNYIESIKNFDIENKNDILKYYNAIKNYQTNGINNELKEFFISELIELDNFYFSIDYLIILGILGIIFKEDDFLYKFLNYLRISYNKITSLYRENFINLEPIKNLLKQSNFLLEEILNKEKLTKKIQYLSKTKYDITNLLITKTFEPFIREDNIDIIEKIKIIIKYLFQWGKISYAAIYSINNYYKIEKIYETQSRIFKNKNLEFSFSFFNQLISTGEPITHLELPDNFKNPIFICLIPILTENINQKRKSTSYYYLDTFRYYIHLESRFYINPFWNINKEVFYFISNLLSFATRYNDILFENLYDPLTNVYLRNSFIKRVKISLSNYKKGSLFFIDIDNFKQINDTFGHNYGDKVLHEIAKIIKTGLRANDIVGRYGGEEFLVFIPNLDYENSKFIAERIKNNINSSTILSDRKISVTIGISVYPEDSNILDILIQKAEIANRIGKRKGKNTYIKYSPSLEINILETDKTYGLICRDPIKTQENIKTLLKIVDIHNSLLNKICFENKNNLNIINSVNKNQIKEYILNILDEIKKTIFFDIFIINKNENIITNLKNKNFINEIIRISKDIYGFTKIYNRPYNYLKIEMFDLRLYIGNFKGFTYNDELNNLLINYINSVKHILDIL
ncbi:MAG: diguanylate cyclase [Spirochaetes bacterium]|nr:diguanylate cyclase [Spirochaetota bacterium]